MQPNLSERQKLILSLVIHEYTRTAQPVSSGNLVEQYHLSLSSATVRSELAELTEMGYLRQPHTAAGRVPSEEGYRYFVGRLLQEKELPDSTRDMITHQFYQSRQETEEWMRLAASVLAHQSRAASLVTAPHPERTVLKHLELISTHGRQVLMVMVMLGGEIHQRLVTMAEPISQEQLTAVAQRTTALFQGQDTAAIRAQSLQLQGLDADVANWLVEDIHQADSLAAGEVYIDGLSNVLAEPEFAQTDEARRAMRVLEERSTLQHLLGQTILASGANGVQVIIGGESSYQELSQFSMVLARYGTPGLATGTLGVLGPMRMPYGRTISTVRFVANILSDLVSDTLGD